MPKFKRGSSWKHTKQHRPVSDSAVGRPPTKPARPAKAPMQQLVQLLWCEDYWDLIEKILDDNPQLRMNMLSHLEENKSRYSERLSEQKLVNYMQKQKFKLANVIQSMLAIGHSSSGTDVLKLIKSMVRCRKQEDQQLWTSEVKSSSCLEKKATVKYVSMMGESRPPPQGEFSELVVEVCVDQLHLRDGCRKGGKHRSAERTDEDGKKVTVKGYTVMNLHEYPIKVADLALEQSDIDHIREHGPHTEDLDNIYDELDYDKAVASLHEFWEEDCEILSLACGQHGVDAPDLSIFQLLASRPQHHCPKTPMKIHQPKLDRDTNNYDDTQEVYNWILSKFPKAIAIIIDADGQGNGMLHNAARVRPERYVAMISKAADMHGEGHSGYSQHEAYFEALIKCLSEDLEFKKVMKRPKDLDQDRFDNHKGLNMATSIAAKFVLVELYGMEAVRNSRRLQQTVEANAGHKVLFHYALEAGGPQLMWQRAQRSNRGTRLNQCWAWAFHTCRAAHKVNYITYIVQRSRAIRCTHPKIQTYLHLNPSMSNTGRDGTMQAKDRRLEYMHAECSAFNKDPKHAIEDVLFLTMHFDALDHVNTKWNEMLGMDLHTPMEAKKGFLDTVKAIICWMQTKLGEYSDQPLINPFTGLYLEKGDFRVKQPWLFFDQVATGQCGTLQHPLQKKRWQEVVAHIIAKQKWQGGNDVAPSRGDWEWMEEQVDAFNDDLDEL
jgi:hypothetical protein